MSNRCERAKRPIPYISAATHVLRVDGLVHRPLDLSPHQLRTEFPQHTVTCALQCAGNRRHTMRTLLKEVDGIDWRDGAVMNARWRGPRLRDVLSRAGVSLDDEEERRRAHVAFACFQTKCQDDGWYGGSIALERGMSVEAEVILALDMNDKPLPPSHGFPVRALAPGIAGARSVKWLDRITVQLAESQNYYQQHDYKILPPQATSRELAKKYWPLCPSIQGMPVNSVVCVPTTGDTVVVVAPPARGEKPRVEVRGYALPAGDHGPIVKVEVSADDGRTWTPATLTRGEGAGNWAWTLWRAEVALPPGEGRRVVSRATDRGGNVQSESAEWNFRGVAYNGWGEARGLNVVVAAAGTNGHGCVEENGGGSLMRNVGNTERTVAGH
ncbi:hypothetical protein FGG08_000054 [Glutinoglossum americanum]|uniref:Sulfite oxidase n=1 Tax=Glutinoglossum americanum TaxID=1670608 RepID=A0A9P8IIL8_9PEZI|nr:hypothetical protein FGG08_000054 [Glutinoglossum americanum]